MKTKIICFLFFVIMIFNITGCAKLIKTEYENVEVTITDKYYRGMYPTPMKIGKTMTIRLHPAVYRITVTYNNIEYVISGENVYEKYKDKIGQTTTGKLEIRTYDDDSVKYDILSLE